MVKIGYVRVSTRDKNLDWQIESLEKIQVDKLFCAKMPGVNAKCPQLQNMLD